MDSTVSETEVIKTIISAVANTDTIVKVTVKNRGSTMSVLGKLYTRLSRDEYRVDAENFTLAFSPLDISRITVGIDGISINI